MGIPKLVKTAQEVLREYNIRISKKECDPLSHVIDTSGSCNCGFFHEGKPSGDVGIVPNRATRRRVSSFKRQGYVLTKADMARMKEERERNERRKEARDARRADRKRASLSGRTDEDDQQTSPVSILADAEVGAPEEG